MLFHHVADPVSHAFEGPAQLGDFIVTAETGVYAGVAVFETFRSHGQDC